jgi:Domain of unknown function (DUF4440)
MLNTDMCGSDASGPAPQQPSPAGHEPVAGALDELAVALWVRRYEAAWLDRDWNQLERCLAADVAMLSPGMSVSIVGRKAVLAHLRAMMREVDVHEYNTTDLDGRFSGGLGIVSYQWQLDWTVQHRRQQLNGRDVLLLQVTARGWQLLRRVPLLR